MKYLCIGWICVWLSYNGNAQTVISYGKHKVQLNELMQAYNKNRTQGDTDVSLKEYLRMYADFKLKVQAAREIRLDTLQSVRQDVQNFRSQMVEPYLMDKASANQLLEEAVLRSKTDKRIAYFFTPRPSGGDSTSSYAVMQKVYNALVSGRNDFDNMAIHATTQLVKVSFIDAGFVTAFSLPYALENVVYALRPGEVSKPFSTSSGYHIIKVLEERPHIGEWKIAQILIALPESPDKQEVTLALAKSDSLYQQILQGANFGQLAKQFSDDKFSFSTFGELPAFSTGKFAPDFETQVLQLTQDGMVSKPFRTAMGFHILKRISHVSMQEVKPESWKQQIQEKLMKDNRMNISRNIFNKQIEKSTGFRVTHTVKQDVLIALADSVKGKASISLSESFPESTKPVARFKDRTITVSDWLAFVQNYTTNFNLYKGEPSELLWEKFKETSVRNYYKDHLEKYNPDFQFQMQEFLEGNMLFEVMERHVWGKAATDSASLEQLYAKQPEKYRWDASADMILFHVTDLNEAKIISQKILNRISREVIESEHPYILTDSGRFETDQLFDPTFTPAPHTVSPFKVQPDGTVTFVYIVRLHQGGEQKSFAEARGLVINDYQDILEAQWLEALRKKYPVRLYESVLK
ncbi:MAG: peptidylprolyl isomerase [Ferruginibacter sp.]|nr:peptidylprolyl isomerase [Ferruginibacter sp.]